MARDIMTTPINLLPESNAEEQTLSDSPRPTSSASEYLDLSAARDVYEFRQTDLAIFSY